MKKSLPANAKISKEAKETVQECVSEFISFVTGEASDKCQKEKRKTINGDDLLWAMTTLGFENYVGTLKVYLSKYRETEGEKNTMANNDGDHQDGEKITAKTDFLQGFNSGNYQDPGQVVIGHSESLLSSGSGGGFDIGKRLEFDRNGKRAMAATSLHHGVEW